MIQHDRITTEDSTHHQHVFSIISADCMFCWGSCGAAGFVVAAVPMTAAGSWGAGPLEARRVRCTEADSKGYSMQGVTASLTHGAFSIDYVDMVKG